MDQQPVPDTELGIVKDFLLAEHAHFSQLFRENEALGERRMQFFLGLVAAVIAGITALATAEKGLFRNNLVGVVWVALGTSILLLVVGWLTYERLRQRDKVTEEYKQILDKIRLCFGAAKGSQLTAPRTTSYDPFDGLQKRHRVGRLARMSEVLTGLVVSSIVVEIAYLCWQGQYPVLGVGAAALVIGFVLGRHYKKSTI